MYPTFPNLGRAVQHYRTQAHMTQEQLAARLGVSRHRVRRIEHRVTVPGAELICAIARACGVRTDVFIHCTADPKLRAALARLAEAMSERRAG